MRVSTHQPSYFPWLGLLDKINQSDYFVLMDNVQLLDRGYQHRNLFMGQSESLLLTIPFVRKDYLNKPLNELEISGVQWRKKHLKSLVFNYSKTPFFDEIFADIEPLYQNNDMLLIEFLKKTMALSMDWFDIKTPIVSASTLALNKEAKKGAMVIDILQCVNATTYLSGTGASVYQKEEHFTEKNIALIYQSFTHPTYPQYKRSEFVSGLSSLDAAFNLGRQGCPGLLSKEVIA